MYIYVYIYIYIHTYIHVSTWYPSDIRESPAVEVAQELRKWSHTLQPGYLGDEFFHVSKNPRYDELVVVYTCEILIGFDSETIKSRDMYVYVYIYIHMCIYIYTYVCIYI